MQCLRHKGYNISYFRFKFRYDVVKGKSSKKNDISDKKLMDVDIGTLKVRNPQSETFKLYQEL